MAWATNPTTAEELQAAVDAATDGVSTTITLGGTIDGGTLAENTQVLDIPTGKVIVLDLASHDITANAPKATAYLIKNAGRLTIQGGGQVKNTYAGTGSVRNPVIKNLAGAYLRLDNCSIIATSQLGIRNEGELVVEEGVTISSLTDVSNGIVSQASAIASYNSTASVTINGGTFYTADDYSYILYQEDHSRMVINGGTFNTINGKPFYIGVTEEVQELVINGGAFGYDPTEHVAQGYIAVFNSNTSMYEIKELLPAAEYTVNSEAELINAIAAVTEWQPVKMTVGSDFAVEGTVTLPHGSEIVIPAGKTLTVKGNGLFVNNGIVTDKGTIAISGQGFFSNPTNVAYEGDGKMTMEGFDSQTLGETITYKIKTPMHLQYLAYLVMNGKAEGKTWNITLENDITIPEGVNFTRIHELRNTTFDGKNHTIDNLKMTAKADPVSLFERFGGTIKNVTINADMYSESANASILCRYLLNHSIVENVELNGSATSGTSSASAFVVNIQYVNSDMYETSKATNYLWFVNCKSNVNVHGGGFTGLFFATMSQGYGTLGFYNCEVSGTLTSSAKYHPGIAAGYTTNVAFWEFINFKSSVELEYTGSSIKGYSLACEGGDYTIANMFGEGNPSTSNKKVTKLNPTKYTAVWNGTKYVAQENGQIDNTGETSTIDWAENTTWTNEQGGDHFIVPSSGDNVVVNNTNTAGVVVTTEDAVAKSVTVNTKLTVEDGGKLTIGEGGLTIANGASVTVQKGATLIIGEEGVTNNGGTLVIEATKDDGAGVVLVDPAATTNNHPTATIKLIPDAHKVSGDNYIYRYIGIPLYLGGNAFDRDENLEISNTSVDTYLKSWNPATGWQNIGAWSELVPFKGYAISNESTENLTYTFKGQLMGNADGAMTFKHGFNMFANSYTAPIDIRSLIEGLDGDNVDLTIYMFENGVVKSVNMGSFGAYEDDPAFTKIPSMQAFFVHVSNDNASAEAIDYAQSVFTPTPEANGALYAPARQATPDFNRVRINVADENGATDAVYMIESAGFTNEFDNGYDAVKYMNNGLNLFATTAHGRQSSAYSNDIEGSFIGVQGNGTYTMSFDKLAGEEYQIRDLENDAVITMSENNTYTFTVNGTNEARFVVETIAKMPTAIDNVNAANMFVSNNTLFVGANNADIQIYGANGQLVLSEKAQPTVDLSGLATGVYTVRVANQTLKFVK